MDPFTIGTALSLGASFLSSNKQKKAEQEAARRANALASEQRSLADSRETQAASNNINSIQSQRLSDLTNINFASREAQANAQAVSAGSGLSGASLSELSTQVMIDSARDMASMDREANAAINDVNSQLDFARQNRAIEARYGVQGSKTSVGQNMLNSGLQTLTGLLLR